MPRFVSRIEDTSSIEDHARLIQEQVEASLRDPQTRKLAASIVSGTYDWVRDPRTGVTVPAVKYHGRYYRAWYDSHPPGPCPPRDDVCALTALWNFMVMNVRYTPDVDGYDTYPDLRTMLESGAEDCDGFTVGFCALSRAAGYPCVARIISQDGKEWAHVYPLVQIDRGWIPVDATEDGKMLGWEYPRPAAIVDFDMGSAA